MFKNSEPVEIVVIADRSGSMESIAKDAIGGFNTFLKEQQALPGEANFTLVLFDNVIEVPIDCKPIASVEPLTDKTFVPRGGTALFDAIGRTLIELERAHPKRAIVCILTDGEENSSSKYTRHDVKRMIENCEKKDWKVLYLAANQDAFAVGSTFGVLRSNTKNFDFSGAGVHHAYAATNCAVTEYRSNNSLPTAAAQVDWSKVTTTKFTP